MSLIINTTRFGEVRVAEEQVLTFPSGLIGIAGSRYALLLPTPNAVFPWLQSLENPAFALPVVNPRLPYPDFVPQFTPEDEALLGREQGERLLYVTVCARPDPAQCTVNLRAPIVIVGRRGFQLLNQDPQASLRAPLLRTPSRAAA